MKQVWVYSCTCCWTRATTSGAELPTVVTAIPEPKSISELPSTSTRMPPAARAANTGITLLTPEATAALRRAASSSERGPGIAGEQFAALPHGGLARRWRSGLVGAVGLAGRRGLGEAGRRPSMGPA